jgi:hypothetical protein
VLLFLYHTGAIRLRTAAQVKVALGERILRVAVMPHKCVELLQLALVVEASGPSSTRPTLSRQTEPARQEHVLVFVSIHPDDGCIR